MNIAPALYIVGLGSQACAWALNLRDSGLDVTVGLRPESSSFEKAESLGIKALSLEADFFSEGADKVIALLIPDHEMETFFAKYQSYLKGNESFLLAHGASYPKILSTHPQLRIGLLAPKAIASELRFRYETKGALGAAIARGTLKEETYQKLPDLCQALGIMAGPFEVTIEQETNADLFSEQALLCGLLPYAFRASFEKLIAKGIPEDLAFMECWVEGELIASTLCQKGPLAFFSLISPNALLGADKASKILIDHSFQEKLEKLWQEIESQEFIAQAASTDIDALRARMMSDWESSPVSKTFLKLKSQFYPKA